MKNLIIILLTMLLVTCNQLNEIPLPNYSFTYLYFDQYDFDGLIGTKSPIIVVDRDNLKSSNARIAEAECGALHEEFIASSDSSFIDGYEYIYKEINDRDANCDEPIIITIESGSRVLVYKEDDPENIGDLQLRNCTQILVEEGAELIIWGDIDLVDSQIYALDSAGNIKEDGYEQLFFLKGINSFT